MSKIKYLKLVCWLHFLVHIVKLVILFLNSFQLALEEINDKNVIIIPRDSGFNNDEKLNLAVNEMKSSGVK